MVTTMDRKVSLITMATMDTSAPLITPLTNHSRYKRYDSCVRYLGLVLESSEARKKDHRYIQGRECVIPHFNTVKSDISIM